jgi:hypothetical protein
VTNIFNAPYIGGDGVIVNRGGGRYVLAQDGDDAVEVR